MIFSLSTWNKLPSDIQDVLREGAVKFGQEHREAVASQEAEQLEKLKDVGMVVNESPDIESFKNATVDVYTKFEMQNEWTAELVSAIRAEAAKAK